MHEHLTSGSHSTIQEVDSTDEVILPSLADLGLFNNSDALEFPEDELFLYRRLLLIIRDEKIYQGILEHDEAQVQVLLDLIHHVSLNTNSLVKLVSDLF